MFETHSSLGISFFLLLFLLVFSISYFLWKKLISKYSFIKHVYAANFPFSIVTLVLSFFWFMSGYSLFSFNFPSAYFLVVHGILPFLSSIIGINWWSQEKDSALWLFVFTANAVSACLACSIVFLFL